MPRADETPIHFRLVIDGPLPGVVHSLQDKAGAPDDAKASADGSALTFEFALRLAPGPKGPRLLGEHLRSEGPARRFVYIAVGRQAGEASSCWDRRMKIDLHTLPPDLLVKAAKGSVLEAVIPGRGKDGTPACATVQPLGPWRAV